MSRAAQKPARRAQDHSENMTTTDPTREVPTPRGPRRTTLMKLFVAMALVTWISLRTLLWLHGGVTRLSGVEFASAMFIGIWLDLATLGYLVAPMLLVAALLPNRFLSSRVGVIARPT